MDPRWGNQIVPGIVTVWSLCFHSLYSEKLLKYMSRAQAQHTPDLIPCVFLFGQ